MAPAETSPTPGDADLVRRARAGERSAFEDLIRRHMAAIYALALRESPSLGDAEDVAQEAFVRAYASLDQLEEPAAFAGWVRRIAQNLARDAGRARVRRGETSDRSGDEDGAAYEAPSRDPSSSQKFRLAEARRSIIAAIAALPEDYAQVAAMKYVEDLDYGEMEKRLGLNREALRKRLHRANLMLRRELKSLFPEFAEGSS